MQLIFSPGLSGDCGISTAIPSHPQAATIAVAATAKSVAATPIGSVPTLIHASLNARRRWCQARRHRSLCRAADAAPTTAARPYLADFFARDIGVAAHCCFNQTIAALLGQVAAVTAPATSSGRRLGGPRP